MRRLRVALAALALALAGTAFGCGREAPASRPPSLVLISIDSLRADRLGCYGAERDTSPAIDAFCRRGVRFENAVAPTSWTLPSHVTLLSGLTLPAHRVVHPQARIDPSRRLLAEHLAAQGYATGGFVSAPFLDRFYGFARGFEDWKNFGVRETGETGEAQPDDAVLLASHEHETAPQVIAAAVDWLAGQPLAGERPFFLFVHLWDVHYDFLPPPPYDRMFDPEYAGDLDPRGFQENAAIHPGMADRDLDYLRALYDGEIRWLDSELSRLLRVLEARASSERIAIALVSDHGDEFFEHGEKGHLHNLYEESVRVPFILVDPERLAPRTEAAVVGLDDVAPTLLGLAGLPPLPEATGRDLAPALAEGTLVSEPKLLSLRQVRGLRGDGWKVLHDTVSGFATYYDLRSDPGEQQPLPARTAAPEKLAELERVAAEAHELAKQLPWAGGEARGLTRELEEALGALGYLD